jgi:hypothetical protein
MCQLLGLVGLQTSHMILCDIERTGSTSRGRIPRKLPFVDPGAFMVDQTKLPIDKSRADFKVFVICDRRLTF